MKITFEEFNWRKSCDLTTKILFSRRRIEDFYNQLCGRVVIAFSGGKDSCVLLHLVRSIYPEVPAIFNNSGLEAPEIIRFNRTIENLTWLSPKKHFPQIVKEHGWPVISKEVSHHVDQVRHNVRTSVLLGNGKYCLSKKWRFLINAPFPISDYCCKVLKKNPAHCWMTKNLKGGGFYIGERADESRLRLTTYMKYGCIRYLSSVIKATPLAFWTHEDIEEYLRVYNVPYPEDYYRRFPRTGCLPCLFGITQNPDRILKIKEYYPGIYKWLFRETDISKVLDFLSIPY